MTIASRLLAGLQGLPRARSSRVQVERDLQVPMRDGAVLLADRWWPAVAGGDRAPIVLTRSPYGGMGVVPRLYAERGYQVVVVRNRGTFGSEGEWRPFRDDVEDGRAVLEWLAAQPWFIERVGLLGSSYGGWAQWALVDGAPTWLKAIAPAASSSSLREFLHPGGSFSLESALLWMNSLEHQEQPSARKLLRTAAGARRLRDASLISPLADADAALVGRRVEFFQDWLAHPSDDPWWATTDHRSVLATSPPVSLVAGWYDVFVAGQLDDYRRLREAGVNARLTIGPWRHASVVGGAAAQRETLSWFDEHLLDRPRLRSAVRVFVMGAGRWVDLPAWPPPAEAIRWHLHPGRRLSVSPPPVSEPDRYRYDPTDPTPGVGGATLQVVAGGPKDNAHLETRSDVLTFTSDPLDADVTVIGELSAELFVRSSLEHTDFFVRLCDVSPGGKSVNISDGITRLRTTTSGPVSVQLLPTAMTFRRGHRIRVQVSSGAHPMYARNPGSGEPLGKATTFVAANQEIHHDPERPSAIVLPVVAAISPMHPRRLAAWRS